MASQRIPVSIWRERVIQRRSSGLSAQACAEQSSIPRERLSYWSRRLARTDAVQPLIPVKVSGARVASDIILPGPSGWALRLGNQVDPSWLASLLVALR
jgi:hypothetical protein